MSKILLSYQIKVIFGYPNYSISSSGVVTNIKTNKTVKAFPDKDGYSVINLYNKAGMKTLKIHRLVASAFIDNPCNLPQINHRDGNKSNNALTNIEWCSGSSNMKHAHEIGLIKKRDMRGSNSPS